MAWSNDVSTRRLTGSYQSPSGAAAQGTIRFRPTTKILDQDDAVIVNDSSLTATLNGAGSFSIILPTTDNKLLRPQGWAYEVTERIYGVKPETYYILLPYDDGSDIDISNVTVTTALSVSSGLAGPSSAVRGPIGPPGATGPTGPTGATGSSGVVVQPTPPADTSLVWVDNS